jgi:hypothetical protein
MSTMPWKAKAVRKQVRHTELSKSATRQQALHKLTPPQAVFVGVNVHREARLI